MSRLGKKFVQEDTLTVRRAASTSDTHSALDAGNRIKQAIYLDSPVLLALNQIRPFFASGIFGEKDTPVFLRVKALTRAQLAFVSLPKGLDIRPVSKKQVAKLPLEKGGVQFYPFNSQSNLNAVTNRDVSHVLTLHGESNKLASFRPAARIFDYVTVAGPLARDRYLQAGIFTKSDVDNGRLVMMGDSFVQSLPWFRPARSDSANAALVYCPTWEGYGSGAENYSSIRGLYGFHAAAASARAAGVNRICVKPHPYLGLLKPRILGDFVTGLNMLDDQGFQVEVLSRDANPVLRMMCKARARRIPLVRETCDHPVDVAMGLCDVSGMEAVFLKQGIRHMTIATPKDVPKQLRDFYGRKALFSDEDCDRKVSRYLAFASEIDARHHAHVFGWQDPQLKDMSGAERRAWLIDYVKSDPFWRDRKKAGRG